MTVRQGAITGTMAGSMTVRAALGTAAAATLAGAGSVIANAIEWNNITVSMSGLGTLAAAGISGPILMAEALAGAGALASAPISGPIIIPIGTFVDLGHVESASTVSLALTITNPVAAGDMIGIVHYTAGSTGTIQAGGVSDGSANVYTRPFQNNVSPPVIEVYTALASVALPAGTIINVNFSGANLRHAISAFKASSIAASNAFDQNTNVSRATGIGAVLNFPALSQAVELQVLIFAGASNPGTIVWDGGFTQVGGNTATAFAIPACRIVGSASPTVASPTWPNSVANAMVGVTFAWDAAASAGLFRGAGGLTASLGLTEVATANFAGAGSLAVNVGIGRPVSAALSGAGALSGTVISGPVVSVESMAGGGLLTAQTVQLDQIAVTMSGIGSLAAAAISGPVLTAENFSGSSSLAATIKLAAAEIASLSGSGALAADATVSHGGAQWQVAANFVATGALVADITGGISAQPSVLGGRSGNRPPVYGIADVLLPRLRAAGEIRIGKPPHELRASVRLGALRTSARGGHGVSASAWAKLPPMGCSGFALRVPIITAARTKIGVKHVKARAGGRHDNFSDAELEALAPWAMLILGD